MCRTSACAIGIGNTGSIDCNVNPNDGCEARVDYDDTNCASCGNVCSGGTHCNNGSCQPATTCGAVNQRCCPSTPGPQCTAGAATTLTVNGSLVCVCQ